MKHKARIAADVVVCSVRRLLLMRGEHRVEQACNGALFGHLFLNQYGQPLSPDGLSWRVRDYFKQAGIAKRGACHLFRHTMATAMLDNGADIRHVQEILGHGQITSTRRYTHVSIARLHAVHAATHPASRLDRRHDPDTLSEED